MDKCLMEEDYASPWTAEEMDMLAVEAGELLDVFGRKFSGNRRNTADQNKPD
jgi:hypothetical protein